MVLSVVVSQLEFGGEVELDVREVLLGHTQYIRGVGEEDVTALCVFGHVLIFALLEVVKLGRIISLNPAGFVEMQRLPTAFRVVLMLQTVLDDLELQLTHSADDTSVVELVDKELGHTFVHELRDTLDKLLRLHRIVVLNILKELR